MWFQLVISIEPIDKHWVPAKAKMSKEEKVPIVYDRLDAMNNHNNGHFLKDKGYFVDEGYIGCDSTTTTTALN